MAIQVIIVDDHKLFSQGMASILAEEETIEVVEIAENGKKLLTLLQTKHADVILLDITMPELDGVATTRLLKEKYPKIKILVVSMHNSPNYILQLIKMGVDGYTLKDVEKQEVLKAIQTIYNGDTYYDPRVSKKYFDSIRRGDEISKFTERELEVIRFVCQGKKNKEIAGILHISLHTVEAHRRNIRTKANVSGNLELERYAREHKLI